MHTTFAQESMGRRVNLLYRLSMRHVRNEMKKLGIGVGDYSFLIISYFLPGLSQDELSRHMHVDKSYTARAVAKLEKMGLVERRPDPESHRIKRVFLTQMAMDMEDEFFGILTAWQNILVKDIDPGDLKIIRGGLDKMMENAGTFLDGKDADPFLGIINHDIY